MTIEEMRAEAVKAGMTREESEKYTGNDGKKKLERWLEQFETRPSGTSRYQVVKDIFLGKKYGLKRAGDIVTLPRKRGDASKCLRKLEG